MVDLNLDVSDDKNDNIISNELILFMQELEIGMNLVPNDIWGIDSINLSRYLFNRYITTYQIKNEISNYVVKNCYHAKFFNYKVAVETINIDNKDLIYIMFTINALDEYNNNREFIKKFLIGS